MKTKLLSDTWTNLDYFELRHLLHNRIGGPGQYGGPSHNKLYLPLGGSACRIVLNFRDKKIVAIKPGPAFNTGEWKQVSEDIEKSIINGLRKFGRAYSFSSFRVQGSWRGHCSGVQILPPPDDAPRADVEIAEHPFILEFPIKASNLQTITNYRRLQEHRNLTLLLNVLLAGRTSLQPSRPKYFWAIVSWDNNIPEIKWVQQSFFAKLGETVINEFSLPTSENLEQVEPEEYYTKVGHDGKGLRVPTDLDTSIYSYMALSAGNRVKFNRATFWMYMASRQWDISVSASFAALVSAIESLTERGGIHTLDCPICGKSIPHEVPGANQRFKDFLDKYAPGAILKERRARMYSLRSGILHGSYLMELDQDRSFGWDPPWLSEYELHAELWSLTQIALRNWLKNPPATRSKPKSCHPTTACS